MIEELRLRFWKLLVLVILVSIFISCGSHRNEMSYQAQIYSVSNDEKITVQDSTYQLPTLVNLKRSRDTLHVELESNNRTIDFYITPRLAKQYEIQNLVFNNFWKWKLPSKEDERRYTYGNSIFLNTTDSIRVIKAPRYRSNYRKVTSEKPERGLINLTISLPFVNLFNHNIADQQRKIGAGFLGIGVGVNYNYAETRLLSIEGLGALNFPLPFPAPIDYVDTEVESFSTFSLFLEHHHIFKNWQLGYGVHYSADRYLLNLENTINPELSRTIQSNTNNNLGVNLSLYRNITKRFKIGIKYRPSLFETRRSNLVYNDFITLDLQWCIPIVKK